MRQRLFTVYTWGLCHSFLTSELVLIRYHTNDGSPPKIRFLWGRNPAQLCVCTCNQFEHLITLPHTHICNSMHQSDLRPHTTSPCARITWGKKDRAIKKPTQPIPPRQSKSTGRGGGSSVSHVKSRAERDQKPKPVRGGEFVRQGRLVSTPLCTYLIVQSIGGVNCVFCLY